MLFLAIVAGTTFVYAQADSLAIVNADWQVTTTADGLVHKRAQIKGLYGSVQSINLIEIAPSTKHKVGIAGNQGMKKTSQQAEEHGAVAAINGTYYNMKEGNSVCFYKIGRDVIDNTTNFKNHIFLYISTAALILKHLSCRENVENFFLYMTEIYAYRY